MSGWMAGNRRQSPVRRANPSGTTVWVARYKGPGGKRRIAKPHWNGGKGTFRFKRDAQRAIDEAVERAYGLGITQHDTVESYFQTWTQRHPRAKRTNATNEHRIGRVLDVQLDGRRLGGWRLDELRRRHALELVDHLLREQGRAVQGVRGILGSLSVLCENAIDDEVAGANPFKGLRLRRNDPRARKASRPVKVWSFDQIRAFAAGGRPEARRALDPPLPPHNYEALLLIPGLTGLRLGEFIALRRQDFDGEVFTVSRTAHEGEIQAGTKSDHGEPTAGRAVPCPRSLARLIREMPVRIDSDLLFPTPKGKLWRERNFYRDVWYPAQRATGMDPIPHHFRHSYITQLRAAGIDDADLAGVAGHTVETMVGTYTHALGRSHDRIRKVIG